MNLAPNRVRRWLLVNTILFVCLAVADQATKSWASDLPHPVWIGPIGFFAFSNAGVLGGYLADQNPWIIRIFFSVLFGFLCIATALIAHFLSHKNTPLLKAGLIVYLTGTLGNVWDRMSVGAVTDYILLDLPGFRGTAFNLSDVVVVAGFILIAVSLFKERDALWRRNEQRRGSWIDSSFQKSFGFLLALTGFAHFFVIALYSFTFLKVSVGADRNLSSVDADRMIVEYLIGLFVLEAAALALTYASSVFFSHRLVGPLVAFDQYLHRLFARKNGVKVADFRLRKGDYFQDHLESLANRIRDHLTDTDQVTDQNPRE